MLREALEAQLRRSNPSSTWNEIVIDTRSIEADPTQVIIAFFYLSDSTQAQRERQAFIRFFGLPSEAVPLLHLNLHAGARGAAFTPA